MSIYSIEYIWTSFANQPTIHSIVNRELRSHYSLYKEFIYICCDDRRGQLSFVRAWVDDIVIANTFFKSPEGNVGRIFETPRIKIDDIIHTPVVWHAIHYVLHQKNNQKEQWFLWLFFSCALINHQLVIRINIQIYEIVRFSEVLILFVF